MRTHRVTEKGFTLVELLVVIGIIGILASLLIPAVMYGKFKGRVTACTNNYRQFALAAAMYAGEDSKGRLPSFQMPTTSLLYPWIVGLPMLKAMETHGIVRPQMWYCPLQPNSWQNVSESFQVKLGRPLATIDDLSKFFTDVASAKYAGVDLNWWVPRRLEGSPTLTFPDASLLVTRLNTPWPSTMHDVTISTRPILSDWIVGSKSTSGDSFTSAVGAHAFGGKIRSVNSGYADGHVVTHSGSSIKWEAQLSDFENSYVFY